MALGTKIRDRWRGNQISVTRPMRHMATQTLHGHVLISRIDDLLPHGVARMLRPVMAGFAEFYSGSLLQKKGIVRCMGGMATLTVSLPNGIMGERAPDHLPFCCSNLLLFFSGELFLRRHGINMTLSAQSFHIPRQKLFLR